MTISSSLAKATGGVIPRIAAQRRHGAEELLGMYNITPSQLDQIRNFRERMMPEITRLIAQFYQWMGKHPDMMAFFKSEAALKHVQQAQIV